MEKRVKLLLTVVITAITASCSGNINPVSKTEKVSNSQADPGKEQKTFLNKAELSQLEKEYGQFKTESFSKEYLEKKLNKWKTAGNDDKLVREIEFARIKHPALYCTVMSDTGNAVLKTYINGKTTVLTQMNNQDSFATFLSTGCGSGSTLATGLFGAWNADGNGNDSFGSNNGTLVNGTTYTSGLISQAFNFDDANNNYVALPDNSLNFTGDYTVSTWIKSSAYSGYSHLVSNGYYAGNYWGFMSLIYSGKVYFQILNGTPDNNINSVGTTTTLTTNTWHHVVFSHKHSTRSRIYFDGVLEGSNTNTINEVYTTTHYPTFGVLRQRINNFEGYARNLQDATTIWTRELTQAEVTELYNAGTGKQYPF